MLIYQWQGKIATLHSLQKNHLTLIIHLHTLREESDELKDCTENRRSAPPTQRKTTIKLTVAKQQQTAKIHHTQETLTGMFVSSRLIILILDWTKQLCKWKQQWQHGVKTHCYWTFGNLELPVKPCRCLVAIHSCVVRTWTSFVAREVDIETC